MIFFPSDRFRSRLGCFDWYPADTHLHRFPAYGELAPISAREGFWLCRAGRHSCRKLNIGYWRPTLLDDSEDDRFQCRGPPAKLSCRYHRESGMICGEIVMRELALISNCCFVSSSLPIYWTKPFTILFMISSQRSIAKKRWRECAPQSWLLGKGPRKKQLSPRRPPASPWLNKRGRL